MANLTKDETKQGAKTTASTHPNGKLRFKLVDRTKKSIYVQFKIIAGSMTHLSQDSVKQDDIIAKPNQSRGIPRFKLVDRSKKVIYPQFRNMEGTYG